jgi:hypothetical protein
VIMFALQEWGTEPNLCTEIAHIVLDTLHSITKVCEETGVDHMVSACVRVLLHMVRGCKPVSHVCARV